VISGGSFSCNGEWQDGIYPQPVQQKPEDGPYGPDSHGSPSLFRSIIPEIEPPPYVVTATPTTKNLIAISILIFDCHGRKNGEDNK
jgi:hypothetical protein